MATKISKRKGILLAGGTGSRLLPSSLGTCKQLMPVYDKPLIYYSLSVLLLAGLRDILLIATPDDLPRFQALLGDGSQFGAAFSYAAQEHPRGIPEALLIGADFIAGGPVALALGDNIFFGAGLSARLRDAANRTEGATTFAYQVSDPHRYGVVEFDDDWQAISIEEKPAQPKSNFAITGLYFYDHHAVEIARTLTPSARGELEITDLNRIYLERGQLFVKPLGRGSAWMDAGSEQSLLDAANYVAAIERRQGLRIGCLEEIVWRQGWIDDAQLRRSGEKMKASGYGRYLLDLVASRAPA
ncbi:MAG: glucose-1-phosphate thymidylyltransferase RfbA [Magnetococcales bacterium]|nr:glucose-1-phosphate thymidylyltransferase RfbA [Magnetococcales bacterium]